MRKYKGRRSCGLNSMGYEVSFCQATKSSPSPFHMFGTLVKGENTWQNVPRGTLQLFFEAEQHLTKWILDLKIPYKRKPLNCRLDSTWITVISLPIVRLMQTFLLALLFLTVLPSSIWVNHCTTGHFSSDYSQTIFTLPSKRSVNCMTYYFLFDR